MRGPWPSCMATGPFDGLGIRNARFVLQQQRQGQKGRWNAGAFDMVGVDGPKVIVPGKARRCRSRLPMKAVGLEHERIHIANIKERG